MYSNFRTAKPSEEISSFPLPSVPAGHPVSLVLVCPSIYTFPRAINPSSVYTLKFEEVREERNQRGPEGDDNEVDDQDGDVGH